MKIFVTGHQGYIGPYLVAELKRMGHFVTAADLDLFHESRMEEEVAPDVTLHKDVREITADDLRGHDCVMHLAAISNDPMGDLNPDITYNINLHGSIRLAEMAKEVGVPKFMFSSSCSIYGASGTAALDESASFNPLSAYAESKIKAEQAITQMANSQFSPIFLRNSTAYGWSSRYRIDLVVNNLLSCALAKGEIRIMSDGSPWRPLIHCKDIARAFAHLNELPTAKTHNQAINIGGNEENYQVKDVAALVQELLPAAKIVFTGEVGNDPRNYQVNFNKLHAIAPDFALEYTLKKGMAHLFTKLKEHHFNLADFDGERFVRLKLLRKNLPLVDA